ncbi:hypothetical protein QJS10_CPA06g01285 [Acorus calamus]|uniref:Uncharacterized protein n=1 Tax=Acorus calamus TaxID=4465 RepID=A0AAV9EQM4_ACOCL|nr:hypothetical protein QJS10_CPA06g01285 [Acorus calamus]
MGVRNLMRRKQVDSERKRGESSRGSLHQQLAKELSVIQLIAIAVYEKNGGKGQRRCRPKEGSKGSRSISHMIEGNERNPRVVMPVAEDEETDRNKFLKWWMPYEGKIERNERRCSISNPDIPCMNKPKVDPKGKDKFLGGATEQFGMKCPFRVEEIHNAFDLVGNGRYREYMVQMKMSVENPYGPSCRSSNRR